MLMTIVQNRDWTEIQIPGNFFGIVNPKINWNNQTQVHDIYSNIGSITELILHLQNFLKNTSIYSQWDDHEVINDFGANWSYLNVENQNRTGYKNLVQEGRKLFFNFSPIDEITSQILTGFIEHFLGEMI